MSLGFNFDSVGVMCGLCNKSCRIVHTTEWHSFSARSFSFRVEGQNWKIDTESGRADSEERLVSDF